MTTYPATILLVDDDEATRYILRRWLTHLEVQAQVQEAANGAQALELVQAHCQAGAVPPPLLILLDLSMPVMGGLKFLERYEQLPPPCRQATAVVIVSATPSAAEQERVQALTLEFKLKPLDITQLANLVRRYLPAALPA